MTRHAAWVPLLILCLAGCATGGAPDAGPPAAARAAPPAAAAPPPPVPQVQRGAWMIEVRRGQEVIWFGGFTPEETESSCETRQRQLQGRSGRALEVTPCGYHELADRPPGTELWIAASPRAFVGASTETDCAKAAATVSGELARNAPGFTLPACERTWMRTP